MSHLAPRRTLVALFAAFLLASPSAALAQPSENPFAIVPGSFHLEPSTRAAGAHEDLVTEFDFAHSGSGSTLKTDNDVRSVIVNLPPGFLGNNTAVPTCTFAQLLGGGETLPACPIASQVGRIEFEVANLHAGQPPAQFAVPIYNMEVTSFGIAAEFGFKSVLFTQVFQVRVRPGDSGLTVTTPAIPKLEPRNVRVTVWGLPASPVHDEQRGQVCGEDLSLPPRCEHPTGTGGPQPAGIPVRPYLANPTGCEPHLATIEADSWEHPGEWSRAEAEVAPIDECDRVPFSPQILAQPTTNSAETSTGLEFAMDVPQTWDNPYSLATAHLDDAVVGLPPGMSLNPSAGSGLGYCTQAQFEAETYEFVPGQGCPPESKLGTVEVETPLLFEKATGGIYLAQPFHNPFSRLLALYIVARIPERGVVVKVAGKVEANLLTGQLTTTFDENPQVPFSVFRLRFRQGATSPLVTPPACGTYTAESDLTPWSAPLEPRHLTASFPVDTGVNGGPCPSGGLPPFHPGLVAGSTNNAAGHYTPFYIRLSRQDGEQEITHFSIKLPPGVLGKLAGIPLCSDAAVAQAKSREHEQGGAEEEASPSCPAASEVGHTIVEAGVGGTLAQAPGRIYLAGPYHGSAISVVAITDAKVGPFDLGTVVVREALRVNPETGEVFVDSTGSDPLPHIVDGIPTHLREIRIYMDRPEFVLNPTSCERTSTASTVLGSGLNFAGEADDRPVTVTSPFQAADCAALPFKPKLKLTLKGKTNRGGAPALRAELTQRPGEASVGKAQVTLPPSEYLFNAHIQTTCARAAFNRGTNLGEDCPRGSIYGHARAITPILSQPLEGPVYLVSGYGFKLPALVAALNGDEINVALVGKVDTGKGHGIRNTFETIPDAPVSKFVLSMDGGNKGLLQNSTDVCQGTHRGIADFTGHNGKLHDFHPLVVAKGCKHPRGAHHRNHTHHGQPKGTGHKRAALLAPVRGW